MELLVWDPSTENINQTYCCLWAAFETTSMIYSRLDEMLCLVGQWQIPEGCKEL